MNIVIAADHGGFPLKNGIVAHLRDQGHTVNDLGVNSADSVDYPDIAEMACREYKTGGYDFGILMCGTGIGVSIAANKIKGIRCALVCGIFAAEMAKKHNNANFLAFGGRIDYPEPVNAMVDAYIRAGFAGDRHARRVDKIMSLEC